MRRELKLYIEGRVIDQFQDTQIQMKSSIQDVADISKVFTELTQAFSVPASPNNNDIFHHFYESDVTSRKGVSLDYNLRRNAVVEIDTITFKTGKVSMEKATIKNGQVESYSITFYGELVSMKDIFGDFKLADLTWDAYNTPYNFNYIGDVVEDNTGGFITYPLISSKRLWDYGGATPSNNINTTTGAIDYRELFPAVKMDTILSVIESYFNVTFTGLFRLDNKWLQAYMWFKNKSETAYVTPPIIVDYASADGGGYSIGPNDEFTIFENAGNPIITISTQLNSITLYYAQYIVLGQTSDIGEWHIEFTTIVNTPLVEYYVDVYLNNVIFTTITEQGSNTFDVYQETNTNNPSLNSNVTFQVRSNAPITIQIEVKVGLYINYPGLGLQILHPCNMEAYSITTTASQDLKRLTPDLKVTEFLQGIIKMFNLTIVPNNNKSFRLETLETWYSEGIIYDVTKYTDVTSIDVARVKLYQAIDYKYQKSEGFLNRAFQGNFMREYGDLSAVFPYDGPTFKLDLPFEDLMVQRFNNTSTCVGYSLNLNFQQYIPKPVVFYNNGTKNTNIYITDGGTNRLLTTYTLMSSDAMINGFVYSLNFGAEISVFYNQIVPNGLYATYYQGYIQNLFNRKNRLTSVKIKLPLSILTSLKLNDRLVIRDKRYIINDYTINLATGEANFVLLNDFRAIRPRTANVVMRPRSSVQYLVIMSANQTRAEIVVPNDILVTEARVQLASERQGVLRSETNGLTISPLALTESGFITITNTYERNAEALIEITFTNKDETKTTEYLQVFITE